jgi:AcrR family transcriptional regulator
MVTYVSRPVTERTRPTLREERKRLTRDRVLEAAVAAFDEKTFALASMEDVAAAAGVTRVTVYAHFAGGKAELVQALITRLYDVAGECYTELAAEPRWTPETLRAWVDRSAARWHAMAPTIRVLTAIGLRAADPDPGRGERRRTRYLDTHTRYVELLTAAPRVWRDTTDQDARQHALMAVLQVESVLTVWATGVWPVDGNPLHLLADALCHHLRPALSE